MDWLQLLMAAISAVKDCFDFWFEYLLKKANF